MRTDRCLGLRCWMDFLIDELHVLLVRVKALHQPTTPVDDQNAIAREWVGSADRGQPVIANVEIDAARVVRVDVDGDARPVEPNTIVARKLPAGR